MPPEEALVAIICDLLASTSLALLPRVSGLGNVPGSKAFFGFWPLRTNQFQQGVSDAPVAFFHPNFSDALSSSLIWKGVSHERV